MIISWRKEAEADLTDLFDYLLERNPQAARRIRTTIIGQIALLAEHPALGRVGRVVGTRELVISRSPYLVAYTLDEQLGQVIILRVLHGAQNWPEDLR